MRGDRRVTLAIILGVSALLAAWAAYWWSSALLGTKSNRASRTASVVCPFLTAGVLAWAASSALGANGIDLDGLASWNGRESAAIFFAVALLLLIPTVLIAMLAGRLFNNRTSAKN